MRHNHAVPEFKLSPQEKRQLNKGQDLKVQRMEKTKVSQRAAHLLIHTAQTNSLGKRNAPRKLKDTPKIHKLFGDRYPYLVRPGCYSSPSSHLCTNPSEQCSDSPTPPERSLQLHPWKSSTTEMTKPCSTAEIKRNVFKMKEEIEKDTEG